MANKIWVINQFANTPDLPGHTRQYELVKHLGEKNFEITVFASDFNLSERKFKKLNKFKLSSSEYIKNVTWNWLRVVPYKKNNWLRKINLMSFCFHLLYRLIIKASINLILGNKKIIFLASTPQLPAAFCALLVAKVFKKKFILEVRDLWPQMLVDQGGFSKDSTTYRLLLYMEKKVYKYAERIIILAKGMEESIKIKGGRNIIWLPNGPSLDKFRFSKIPLDRDSFSNKKPFKIIYTGAHGESNDLHNIILTAKLLKKDPVIFEFFGDGPEKISLLNAAKGMKNIFFFDPVPKTMIPSIIAKADAILVSLKDTKLFSYGVSPNKLYDAYAIGRPVITTISGDINDEVIKYQLGVTSKPSSPKLLAAAIKKLIKMSLGKRQEMGFNARNLSEKIYSRNIINVEYFKIFNDLSKNYN